MKQALCNGGQMGTIPAAWLDANPVMADVCGTAIVWQIGRYADEYAALRGAAGLIDVGGSGPVLVRGDGALEVLDVALTKDMEFLVPERVRSALVLTEDGCPIDVVTVVAVADGEYLVQCGPGRSAPVAATLGAAAGALHVGGLQIADLVGEMSVFAVEGPHAWRAIGRVFGDDYTSLTYGGVLPAEVDGARVLVARMGVTGEYGYTLFMPDSVASTLWHALAERCTLVGHRALETAMLEICHPLIHRECDEHSTITSAGLNWLVDLHKTEFVGRGAVRRQFESADEPRRVGFLVEAGHLVPGMELFAGTEPVGRVRHVVDSPGLGGQLGVAAVARQWQAAALDFTTTSGGRVRTLAAPYVTPESWLTPIEA